MPTSAKPKPPLSRAYTLKASKIPDYFGVLLGNPIPEVFDTAFLAKSGFRYAIDRSFIAILTGLGFLTEAGQPTRRYADFHGRRLSGTVLRQGLAEAYAGLLAELPNAAVCPEREITETVSRYFHGEINDMAASGIAATFLALTRYAASLDNGSASAGVAQRPADVAVAASEPVSSALGASGPTAAAVSAPEPVAASKPATAPEPVAVSEPVAAGSPTFAVAPVATPARVAQAEAAASSVAPAPEPVAAIVAEASLAAAPVPTVAEVPAAATAMPTVPETAATETTPAADTEAADETDQAPGIVIETASPEKRSPGQGSPKHPAIHITLPASTDEAVYDAIFASLKRHLLSPGNKV
jgi:hypothetical protein